MTYIETMSLRQIVFLLKSQALEVLFGLNNIRFTVVYIAIT